MCQWWPPSLGLVISPGFIFFFVFTYTIVCNEHVIIFKDNMAITYKGISRAAPAPGRCKFLVQGRQAPQVTSLGTLPQAEQCVIGPADPALASRGPVSRAVLEWGDCVLRAGLGILPSFLTPFS